RSPPRGAPRASHRADGVAPLHEDAFGHLHAIEVHVERVESLAVVEGHRASAEEEIPDECDPAPVGGDDRRARGCRIVETGVRRAGLAIDDPPRPESLPGPVEVTGLVKWPRQSRSPDDML